MLMVLMMIESRTTIDNLRLLNTNGTYSSQQTRNIITLDFHSKQLGLGLTTITTVQAMKTEL